ncbi:MAG: DUF4926 domain-containing protein [Oscillospiraceae bacterium]|jgi:hypothetical protein|nr:DUF4926 domain-containing protein [Oscillospiraceae bacterium]
MKFFDLDVVRPLVVKAGISVGEIGTVVYVYSTPHEAYMVEFCDDNGVTIEMPDYLPEELELYEGYTSPYRNGISVNFGVSQVTEPAFN